MVGVVGEGPALSLTVEVGDLLVVATRKGGKASGGRGMMS